MSSSLIRQSGLLERVFDLSRRGTDARTEMVAGVTTFMTMAYILAVNPGILQAAGMDPGAVFTATALSSIAAIVVMALFANLPFALAPGMGLNAFFAYTVVLQMGHSWRFALTAVFLEGLIFMALTLFDVREAVLNSIPMNLKRAISVGIGLFIAFIGLVNAGLVVKPENSPVPVQLGDLTGGGPLVAVLGLVLTGCLLARRVKGALLLGMLAATLVGLPLGVTQLPENFRLVEMPPEPALFQFEFAQVFTVDMLIVLLTFLFVDLFDTVGTLIGLSTKAGFLDDQGKLPAAKPALFADAVGTTIGACLGTSTVTSYIESASGVAEGGRTGLTALTTGALFGIALFLFPVFGIIPGAATAPALVLVGLFMMSPIKDIDLSDYTEAVPAFLAMIIMPLTYSIAEGIVFGVLAYATLKLCTGRGREVHWITYILAVIFAAKLALA
jgi:AGZA family xanthine/uracil permease-like MFS transporter